MHDHEHSLAGPEIRYEFDPGRAIQSRHAESATPVPLTKY
jgi:hypothetical protein